MNFWTKPGKKSYIRWRAEKLNTTIEFCIFNLVEVPNFSLNWQFWIFGPNLPRKGISGWKQKKSHFRVGPPWLLTILKNRHNRIRMTLLLLVTETITWETFFLKNHIQNLAEKLFPDPFLKSQNWAYLWNNSLTFFVMVF